MLNWCRLLEDIGAKFQDGTLKATSIETDHSRGDINWAPSWENLFMPYVNNKGASVQS